MRWNLDALQNLGDAHETTLGLTYDVVGWILITSGGHFWEITTKLQVLGIDACRKMTPRRYNVEKGRFGAEW